MKLYNLTVIVYSSLHLVFAFITDLVPLIPDHMLPTLHKRLNSILVDTFNDPFMNRSTEHMMWFKGILVFELLVQIPMLVIILTQLLFTKGTLAKYKDLTQAVYSAHVATTMIPVLSHLLFVHSSNLSPQNLAALLAMYGPFAAIPVWMLVTSVSNLAHLISITSTKISTKKPKTKYL